MSKGRQMKFEKWKISHIYTLKSLWRPVYRWLERQTNRFSISRTAGNPLLTPSSHLSRQYKVSKQPLVNPRFVSLLIFSSAFTPLLSRKRVSFAAIRLIHRFVSYYNGIVHVNFEGAYSGLLNQKISNPLSHHVM